MDTQSAYPHGEGEDDQHHEKTSVMKRVKAKARKIRDSIKKHGPGHNNDQVHEYPEGQIVDDHELDEEDDDEEELVQDHEVHSAPMHDSAAVKNVVAVTEQREDVSRPGITEERPKPFSMDQLASRDGGDYETKHNDPPNRTGLVDLGSTGLAPQNTPLPPSSQVKDADHTKTFLHGEEESKGAQGLEEDLAALKDSSNSFIPTNYETEVTDPTREDVEATEMTPIVHSLDKMNINDDQDRGREENLSFPTGTHDQFSPEPTHQEHPHSVDEPLNQASYTEKITSATYAIADKAVSAKNMVASKFGYGDKDETTTNEPREGSTNQALGMGYEKKMASTVTEKLQGPGTETATEVKTTGEGVEETGMNPIFHSFDKMKINDDQDRGREENLPFPTGTHDQFSPEPTHQEHPHSVDEPTHQEHPHSFDEPTHQEHPHSVDEPTHQEHPHSVDEPLNQASYTEQITSATYAIAGKAVSAKNMVASKFGYGDKGETTVATGAGSGVVSKPEDPGSETAAEVKTTDLQQDKDKEVSMKSYISEKLKPGEEDKALSEVITESFKKPTDDLEIENETRPRGKVTESEEVAKHLGTCDEMKENESSGIMNSPPKTMVETIRGTVGSWFGKGEVQQETEQAHSPSSGNADLSNSSGERTLQDSGK